MDDGRGRQRHDFGLRPLRGEGRSLSGFTVAARLTTTRPSRSYSPISRTWSSRGTFSRGGTSSRLPIQSASRSTAQSATASRDPVIVRQHDTSRNDDNGDSGGGSGGGGGGGADIDAAGLQAAVGEAEEALKRAQLSGVGIATARANLAAAKVRLAMYGFGGASVQVCRRKRGKAGGQAIRPKARRLRRQRSKHK